MAGETLQDNQIVVEKDKLDKVLSEFSALQEKVKVLESIASPNDLSKYYEKTKDRTKRTCRLRTLRNEAGEQKVVVKWDRMKTNEIFQNQLGVTVAKQTVGVTLEDGQEVVGELLDLGRRYEYLNAEKVGEIRDEQGNVKWKVKAENGQTYDLDVTFVN